MRKIQLLFGVHNHQPVGNFDHVFEEVFQKCYSPYFDVLQRFPNLKTAIHFSGPLLEWMRDHQPEYIQAVADWAQAGRLEILSGGFYEPILPSLPEADAIGQIRMMNEFIQEHFGQTPRGLWLAERIWAPGLPKIIAQADLQYTIIDDTHFYYSGLERKDIHGYYITENQGYPLFIFPISKDLRYSIPFELPEVTLDRLRRFREEGMQAVTYGDDGEKFGSWPETYEWVYTQNYLNNLLEALDGQSDWLEVTSFGDFIDRNPPRGRVYLPMASYEEMMTWALPNQASSSLEDLRERLKSAGWEEDLTRRFLRGGQWDNFLTKYEESNNIHKKMLYVSRKVARLEPEQQVASGALQALYRGQCNCAQWHGLFGGLYLNYLRHALYQNLIEAENLADDLLLGEAMGWRLDSLDLNLDGRKEWIASSRSLSLYLAPGSGGTLFELDYRPACFNLSNVLRRRPETYHQVIMASDEGAGHEGDQPQSIHDRVRFKQEGLKEKLIYDTHDRYSFIDRFLSHDLSFDDFKYNRYTEHGNFVGQEYSVDSYDLDSNGKRGHLVLTREGQVRHGAETCPMELKKTFEFGEEADRWSVHYEVSNRGDFALNCRWAVEFNFTLLAGDAPDRYYRFPGTPENRRPLSTQGIHEGLDRFSLVDEYFGFELQLVFQPSAQLWYFPVETVSQSEDGFESVYQGSCMLALWNLKLNPGTTDLFKVDCQTMAWSSKSD